MRVDRDGLATVGNRSRFANADVEHGLIDVQLHHRPLSLKLYQLVRA